MRIMHLYRHHVLELRRQSSRRKNDLRWPLQVERTRVFTQTNELETYFIGSVYAIETFYA